MALNPLDEEYLTNALKVVEKNLDNSEFTTENFAREMLVSRTNLHMKLATPPHLQNPCFFHKFALWNQS